MSIFQKRWFAVIVCIVMIAASLVIGIPEQVPSTFEPVYAVSDTGSGILGFLPFETELLLSEALGVMFFSIVFGILILLALISALLRVGKRWYRTVFQFSKDSNRTQT